MYLSTIVKKRIHLKLVVCILIGILFTLSNATGQSCDKAWLKNARIHLDKLILSYNPVSSLTFADSIKSRIETERVTQCADALWILYNRGEVLELHYRFQEALENYYSLIAVAKSKFNYELMASCHVSIARCMETIGRKADCIRHLLIAKDLIETNKLDLLYSYYWVRYASYQRIYGSKDSCLYFAKLALQDSEKNKNTRQAVDAYMLMGMAEQNMDSSVQYFWKAKNYFINHKNYDGASYMARSIYSSIKKYNLKAPAGNWFDTLAVYLSQIKEHNKSYHILMATFYDERSKIFKSKNQLDSALFYLNLSQEHLKSQNTEVNHSEISQSELDFLISSEKRKADNLLKESNNQKIALWILILGIIVILVVLYNNHLKRLKIEQQQKYILEQNNQLNKYLEHQQLLLSEVHHRVKNNLQLVISLLTLHYNKIKNKTDFHYLEEIANKIRSIALIHEHLYNSGEFERIELSSYVKELLEHYLALHTSAQTFEYRLEADSPIYLNLETTMPIGIICTELISNSLKYARREDAGLLLEFKLSTLENKYILKYQDNGKVNSVISNKNEGMGILLIESMVRQLQAQSSSSAIGTASFNLIFQEKKISQV